MAMIDLTQFHDGERSSVGASLTDIANEYRKSAETHERRAALDQAARPNVVVPTAIRHRAIAELDRRCERLARELAESVKP